MQVPDPLLADRTLPAYSKATLTALWRAADGEPAWTAMRRVDIGRATGQSERSVERAIVLLTSRGAIRRETRKVSGRDVLGFGLSRAAVPLQRRAARARVTTRAGADTSVAKRDKAHASLSDDMRIIAKHASRGDSEVRIAERLERAKAPCSSGRWHNVKVRRRIQAMRRELGIETTGLRAGEIVRRWAAVRG